eukprot:TRINITY_DN204_c0_g1::TRINITY_DN204_c0_g1_i1::g.1703::m.1703 TRINITY_DN204_c0_g1::TRINITY_DN204_c0_g1_i1::g.1703  ORF type:complete len:496 (-),score=88.03,sp/Q9H2A2/AL8A1_HUMAN/49.48/5e-167,Aldedh/PF00171.17/2e-175,DUF1487/PF07368.6/1.1,DUF1487/PF07368.6/0.04,DUF4239/PF14023.1/0.092,LuxC/PF05893.9/0.19 TRINITY_DN204_c0_g1_i1:31-1482(-)
MEVTKLTNFINGECVAPHNNQYIENINPATTKVICLVPRSAAEDVNHATQSALDAYHVWSRKSHTERAAFLDKIADAIEANKEELARMESEDTGKPITVARTVDIPRAIDNFRFFAGQIRHDFTECHANALDTVNYSYREPVGVVGLITPWNLPLYLLSWKVAPALGCGNTVVVKPSELTPQTATALAKIIHSVGVPAGVLNLVHGLGAECGASIVSHPKIRAISFTGGTSTGKYVGQVASGMFKKLSLELGGKNPTIVFNDCDLDKTIEGTVRASFLNQGQICLCGSRILVQEGIYDEYVKRFVEQVQKMKPGDPTNPDTRLGALISAQHFEKVFGYVELAKQEGGKILCGGAKPDDLPEHMRNGAFLLPTVVEGLPISARCAMEEIFGPMVTLHKFKTEDEAIAMANCVEYGLAANLWTQNVSTAHRVSQRLECGMVWVNTWLNRDLRVPFGGVKNSGTGREGGRYSLDFFSEVKNICVKL